MIRVTINCSSCEVKSDIIIRQSNYEDDDVIEVAYCPICSAERFWSSRSGIEDIESEWEE